MSKQKKRKSNIISPPAHPSIEGKFRAHPKGFGFVTSSEGQEIFIPPPFTHHAVDGDIVCVSLLPSRSSKGPEGKVEQILERKHKLLAATICSIESDTHAHAHSLLLGVKQRISLQEKTPQTWKLGDRVLARVEKWGHEREPIIAKIEKQLGSVFDPKTDLSYICQEFSLPPLFPQAVIEEAESFGKKVSPSWLKGRENLLECTCLTVDPDDAKDYDDALSIQKLPGGGYLLGVHIADVAAYVKVNSTLDKEAQKRGNSTYFPGHVVPMLPEALSNNLCSLREGVIRLTVSVLMQFDKTGKLQKSKICRSYIKSKKRFTYGEALAILEGKVRSVHGPTLELLVELCHLLKEKRRSRGSVDLSLPDAVVQVDKNGVAKGIKVVEYDITHQMVEEFMLKANEVVAASLSVKGCPLVYRIHDEPDKQSMEDFFSLARLLGFKVPAKPEIKDVQALFEQVRDTSFAQQLSVLFIRSMKLAIYSPENIGHYGLALTHYCHFTSPIRRYSDLVIQRLLFDEQPKEPTLQQIASRCSETERHSMRAEQAIVLLKKYSLLYRDFLKDPKPTYKAQITQVKPFGIQFSVPNFFLDGFIHISELFEDFFDYQEKRRILVGRHTGQSYQIGGTIEVQLANIDLPLLEAKWMCALPEGGIQKKKRSSR